MSRDEIVKFHERMEEAYIPFEKLSTEDLFELYAVLLAFKRIEQYRPSKPFEKEK